MIDFWRKQVHIKIWFNDDEPCEITISYRPKKDHSYDYQDCDLRNPSHRKTAQVLIADLLGPRQYD